MSVLSISLTVIYVILTALALYLYFTRDKSAFSQLNILNVTFNKILTTVLPIAIIVIGTLIRFYNLAIIPAGLHQDEASIGYEAFILANYGIDRNGLTFPVYPITYGSGGGSPLMIYLNAIFCKLAGSSAFTLRFIPAFLGSLTLIVFFFVVKTLSSESIKDSSKANTMQYVNGEYLWIPLISLTVLSLSPWHMMLSRWSLDSNTTPFWICLALLLFALACKKQKEATAFGHMGNLFSGKYKKKGQILRASDPVANLLFGLSAFVYALTMYSYGAATIVIPLHIIILCIYCINTERMTGAQATIGIITFLIFSAPLILFYAVNYLGVPQIITPFFTITRFTAKRTVFAGGSGILVTLAKNFMVMVKNLSIGNSAEQIVNYLPGYPPLLAFTFPVTLTGLVISAIRAKRGEALDVFWMSLFVPSFIFGLFVEEDINRMTITFLPVVYFMTRGYIFITNEFIYIEKGAVSKVVKLAAIAVKSVAPAIFMVGCMLFLKDYFTTYNNLSSEAFMPGYGQCCRYANELIKGDSKIYSTYEHVSAPYMVALFYTKTPPADFIQTVHYKDENAEFRIADSFEKFNFGLPGDYKDNLKKYLDEGNIFILHRSELSEFDNMDLNVYSFADFAVISAVSP
ncbi:MAG: hypothetical protein K6G06_08325 [Butyrivibrio sp.]|nr:hypothetical protein [Butyrivibrio sp.]